MPNLELYILLFFTYSFAGWFMESVGGIINVKKFINRGFLIGPYCPVYGIGVVIITVLLGKYKNDIPALFFLSILICGTLEYFTSYIMEKLFNARWWDYKNRKFNINGRICLETLIPFGIAGSLILYYVNPFFENLYLMIPDTIRHIIVSILSILFIIDVPVHEKEGDAFVYSTMPIGMIFVRDDFFITVSLRKNRIIEDFEKGKIKNFQTYKKSRFLFQILFCNSSYYLTYLKQINKETEIAEHILKNSMKNRELLKMLNLEKSLVYFATSLKSNEIVMEKTLKGKIIKLYDEDEDILEDAITENRQAIEMAQIYNNILNGTMDAYASIISNNLNGVMKTLTSITIILAVPTMISSFWGMNVNLPFQNNQYGFIIMILIAIITTAIVTLWLNKRDMLK